MEEKTRSMLMMTLENGKELCLKQKVIDLKYSIYISIIMIKILSCILRSYIQCSQKNKHIYRTDYKKVSYIKYFQSFVLDYKLNCNSAGKTSNQNKILKDKKKKKVQKPSVRSDYQVKILPMGPSFLTPLLPNGILKLCLTFYL